MKKITSKDKIGIKDFNHVVKVLKKNEYTFDKKGKNMVGEVKIIDKLTEKLSKETANFYDRAFLNYLQNPGFLNFDYKYKNKKVLKYLKIKIPVIKKHYCEGDDYLNDDGWLITFKEIKLFPIGTEIIKVPVERKVKGKRVIKFKRYK